MTTKEKIVETAFRLFLRWGYNAVSVNTITAAAKISKGGFYHHFKSKRELYEIVLDKYYIDFYEAAINILKQPAPEAKKSYEDVLAFFNPLKNNLSFQLKKSRPLPSKSVNTDYKFVYLVMDGINLYPSVRTRISSMYQKLVDEFTVLFQKAVENGEISASVDPQEKAIALVHLLEGAYDIALLSPGLMTAEKYNHIFQRFWKTEL